MGTSINEAKRVGIAETKRINEKKPQLSKQLRLFKNPAIPTFTLVGTIIGSESLTAVFEMGTGVTFLIWSPGRPDDEYFAADRPVVW